MTKLSILEMAIRLGRSESYIWKLTRVFRMEPDQSPARRIGRSGLYDFEAFSKLYYDGGYDKHDR